MNRRTFLKDSLMLPIALAIYGGTANSQPLIINPSSSRLLETSPSANPDMYVGVWRGGVGTGAQWTIPATDWNSFVAKDKGYFDQGMRIVALSSYYDFDQKTSKYTAVWRSGVGTGAQWTIPATDWDSFVAKDKMFVDQGLLLVAISITNRNGQIAYTGTWRSVGKGLQFIVPAKEWDDFNKISLVNQHFRLVAISTTYNVQGKIVYAGVWRSGVGLGAQWRNQATDWNSFAAEDKKYFDQGLRLVAVSAVYYKGQPKYCGVWREGQGTDAQWTIPATDWNSFAAKAKENYDKGLRLVSLSLIKDQSVKFD